MASLGPSYQFCAHSCQDPDSSWKEERTNYNQFAREQKNQVGFVFDGNRLHLQHLLVWKGQFELTNQRLKLN